MITKEAQFSKYKAYYLVDGTRFMALTILDAKRYAKKVDILIIAVSGLLPTY